MVSGDPVDRRRPSTEARRACSSGDARALPDELAAQAFGRDVSTLSCRAARRMAAMTIGELSRRTGVSVRLLREYEGLGLLYSLGRSAANYRLYDESALWCVRQVERGRSLGLTLRELREVCDAYRRGESSLGELLRPRLA